MFHFFFHSAKQDNESCSQTFFYTQFKRLKAVELVSIIAIAIVVSECTFVLILSCIFFLFKLKINKNKNSIKNFSEEVVEKSVH